MKTKLSAETLNALADEQLSEKVVGTNGLRHALEYINANFVTQDEFNYKPIAINSFTNNKNTQEMGTTITDVVLNWTLNKKAKTLTLDGTNVSATDTSKTLTGQNITTNKTFTLRAVDEKDASTTKTTAITFKWRVLGC